MSDAPRPAVAAARPLRKPQRGKQGGRADAHMVSLRLSADERAALDARAADSGLSRGAYVRAAALGSAGPRAGKRLPVDRALLVKALAHLGHLGGNVNQLSRQANLNNFAGIVHELDEALAEVRTLSNEIRAALGRQELPR